MPKKKETVTALGTEIAVLTHKHDDYISLTDMAKYKNADIPGTVVSHLSYIEMVVFQLPFCIRRQIRLWQRFLAHPGGDNGRIKAYTL